MKKTRGITIYISEKDGQLSMEHIYDYVHATKQILIRILLLISKNLKKSFSEIIN